MVDNTRMCYMRANGGQFVADHLMPLLPRLATEDDVVLLNFGLHTAGNGTLWGYIQELKAFGSIYEKLKPKLPQFIWRQTSVQHFTNLIGQSLFAFINSPYLPLSLGFFPSLILSPFSSLSSGLCSSLSSSSFSRADKLLLISNASDAFLGVQVILHHFPHTREINTVIPQ